MFAHAAAAPPAGGAPIDQVLLATSFAAGATTLLLLLVVGHRTGRTAVLARASAFSERMSGVPGWAALPAAVAGPCLLLALTGLTWDVALHIERGRDDGPLANPSHYALLAGLYGIFAAGVLAVALPERGTRPGPAAVRLAPGWYAPVGGLLMLLCASFALLGFPLDDAWHRLFGQDVTLWGPTHVQMMGGAALTLLGIAVILGEGLRARGPRRSGRRSPASPLIAIRRVLLAGGLLLGVSIFQYEFDFGVPQFRLTYHPLMIGLAAGFALVAARIWIGRGGALAAVAFYLLLRTGVSSVIAGAFDVTFQPFPLYVAEAVVIELVAIKFAPAGIRPRRGSGPLGREGAEPPWNGPIRGTDWPRKRPVAFGALAGLAAGAAGFAENFAWTQVAFPIPWTPALLPEGLAVALVAATAGGVIGALLASGLRGRLPRRAALTAAVPAIALAALLGLGLLHDEPAGVRAQIALDAAGNATVRIDPPAAAKDAEWLYALAYQGRGLRAIEMEAIGAGAWRTKEPLPLDGTWKSFVRLHSGSALMSVPVRAPADAAIPHPGFPAPSPSVTRAFAFDRELLQLERRRDVPGWLFAAATAAVMAMIALFLIAIAAGVARAAVAGVRVAASGG